MDCVGPLQRTKSGNRFILTIMYAATRFLEAIPLRNITTKNVVKVLIMFFSFVGLPASLQSDQASNFLLGVFQQVMHQLNIKQYKSSAYHPESQGALERFHQTMKTILQTYCLENDKDWDEGVPRILFAIRESVQESLGFSPFKLVFGHSVRGPLKLPKEQILNDIPAQINLLDFVSKMKTKLHDVCEIAKSNLSTAQIKMKTWYDRKSRTRSFNAGDKVLILLPMSGNCLKAKFQDHMKFSARSMM